MDLTEIDLALKIGTEDQKRVLLDEIHKVNLIAAAIQYQQRPKQDNPTPGPSTSTNTGDPVRQTEAKPEIALLEVPCTDKSTKNYYDHNGFTYTKKNERAGTIYFRCRRSEGDNCRASVICRDKNIKKTFLSIPHSCVPKEKDVDNLKFLKKLEEIVLENPFKKAMEVYSEAKDKLRGLINMSHIGELIDYNVFIHRKQKADIPLHPKTIEQFEELINDDQYKAKYIYDKTNKLFYHGVWRGPAGANIVFMSQTVLDVIRKKKKIAFIMDGTFKALPNHLKFRQLYIISAIIDDRCYPLMYVLMEKKDTSSYKVLFNKIKELVPNVRVKTCMADYEAATRKAIREVFPKCRLSGCYFHYVQAIVKKFSKFGLKETKFAWVRAQVCALALLPNEKVLNGFKSISKRVKSDRWNRFEQYWLRVWSEANISVYGLKHRTNNFAESLNHTLNTILKSRHPDIWTLINNLKTIESNKSDELRKVVKGHMPRKKSGNTKVALLNKKIKRATEYFNETGRVKKFLKKVTYEESFEPYYRAWIGDGTEDDDGDDGEDEFIGNNFNKKCNSRFRRPTKKSGKPEKTKNKVKVPVKDKTNSAVEKRTVKVKKDTKTANVASIKDNQRKKRKTLLATDAQPSTSNSISISTQAPLLQTESIESILNTFSIHGTYLTKIYVDHVKHPKRNYRPKHIPFLAMYDILTEAQAQAMVIFLEQKFNTDMETETNTSDIIFDAIVPEWALLIAKAIESK